MSKDKQAPLPGINAVDWEVYRDYRNEQDRLDRRKAELETKMAALDIEISQADGKVAEFSRKLLEQHGFWSDEDRTSMCRITRLHSFSNWNDVSLVFVERRHITDTVLSNSPAAVLMWWPVPVTQEEYEEFRARMEEENKTLKSSI